MRASIGLGLSVMVGLVACAVSNDDGATSVHEKPAPSGEVGSSTDPTEPPAPPPATPDDGDKPTPEAPPAPVVRGLSISEVAVFQAVKVPVVKDGALVATGSRKAPVVANRQGLIRVYVTPESSWKPREVTVELRLGAEGVTFPVIRETKTISAASTDEDASSTFNLEVPAESLPPGVTFQVALTAPDGDDAATAGTSKSRFPSDGGIEKLGTELSGKLRVVLVPVKYDADGSGRVPGVGEKELALYKSWLMKLYPTSEVDLTARAPFAWSSTISSNGGGFSQVLRAITQLRQEDKVEKDVYYYGLLTPSDSMQSYCRGGCVTGLSPVVDNPSASGMRASIGIGFANNESASTLAHELGHAHGRLHAPCGGPQGVDPRFPHQGGGIGAWGYDIFSKTLISPAKGRDIMGYCRNEWVSDYTYNAFFDRIAAVNEEQKMVVTPSPLAAAKQAARYRVATVGEAGSLAWDGDIEFQSEDELKGAAIRHAKFYNESGEAMLSRAAKFFAFDHLPGGFLFVPNDMAINATNWKTMDVEGFANKLAR